MYNSTIKTKKKECKSCGKETYIFSKGRCKYCASKESQNSKVLSNAGVSSDLNRWFNERRKEMTGYCKHCGNKSCKGDDKYFKFSISHILPKRLFKSIATHPLNYVELCFWGNNCHGNMDNNMIDLIELNCFDEVIEKFLKIYPDIAQEERKYIPQVLLNYVKDNL